MRTDGAIITNAGQELLSYALANNKQINFTKVKLGKGDVNTFDEAKKLTDVVSFYKQIPITSIARNNAGVVRIRSSFTNAEFPLQVVLKEIGVFAVVEGKSEVLFGYVNDGEGESFPPGSSGNIVERVRDIYVGVSTNTQVTAVIDRSVVYATIYDLDEEIAKCAKKVTRVNPGNGIHGGGTLGEDITISIKSNDTSINLDAANGITLKKTDLTENNGNKLFSAKGAFDLKNWLVTNYTTLMNNIRDSLSNMINLKLPHGGYSGSGQQLKNEIDTKINKAGDTFTGYVGFDKGFRSTAKILVEIGLADKEFPNGINDNNSNFLTDYIAKYTCHNNALTIFGQNAFNARRMAIQSSHSSTSYAEVPGILELNPYGGDVRINGARAYCENYKPTKADVGLGSVSNFPITSSINEPSHSFYATAGAVKTAYDKGVEALNKGNNLDNSKYDKSGGILSGIPIVKVPAYPGITLEASNNEDKFSKMVFEFNPAGRTYFITRNSKGENTGAIYIDGTETGKLYHTGSPPTKAAVGLSLVENYTITDSVSDVSSQKYASALAVKTAHDKGVQALNNSNTKMSKDYVATIGTTNNTDPAFLQTMGVYYIGANGYQGLPAWSSVFNMSPHVDGYSNLQLSWYHGVNAIRTGGVRIRTIGDQGGKSNFESVMVRNGIFDGAGTLNAVNASPDAWNWDLDRVFSMMGGNNKMNFWVNSGFNARQGYIQVGHNDPGYASSLGTLNLNPFGGDVKALGYSVLTKGRMNRVSPVVWSGSSYTAEFTLPDGINWSDVLYVGCLGNNDSGTIDGLFINSMSNGQSISCGYVQGGNTDMATQFTKVSDRVGRFTQSGSGSTGGADQTWPITRVFIRRID